MGWSGVDSEGRTRDAMEWSATASYLGPVVLPSDDPVLGFAWYGPSGRLE